MCVGVEGGGLAYVRSCAHIHQWNVKRVKERGGWEGGFSSLFHFVVFCSLSPLCYSAGLFV